MRNKFTGITFGLALIAGIAYGQEAASSAPFQPQRSVTTYKNNFDNGTDAVYGTIQGWGPNVQFANQALEWDNTGYSLVFSINGMKWPLDGLRDSIDVDFDVMAEAGARNVLCLMPMDGTDTLYIGPLHNDEVVVPDSAMTNWVHVHFHADAGGLIGQWDPSYKLALGCGVSNGTTFGSAAYSSSAKIKIDNLRISFPKKLAGLTRVTGDSSNQNLGTISFSSDGTTLGAYNDWIQNIGSQEIINVFGNTNFGFDSNATSGTNLLMREPGPTGFHEITCERFASALNTIGNTAWLGAGFDLGGTDTYYGVSADTDNQGQQYLFRQNKSATGAYRHFVRCLSDSFYYGSEVEVNLGGEELVAVGDFNADGKDDFVTRVGKNLQVRFFDGNTGSNPSKGISLSAPRSVLNNYGQMKCVAVEDINGDGYDDTLMVDAQGDVFALLFDANGTAYRWLFQLNDGEQILGLADSNNDGLPDLYTTRPLGGGIQEVDTRVFDTSTWRNQGYLPLTSFNYLFTYDSTVKAPCALGDLNGDGSADVVTVRSDALNTLEAYRVNPAVAGLLDANCKWICNANTATLRPIFK